MQGGMAMLRLHRTCWASSYLVHFLRKDRKPTASLLLSLTWRGRQTDRQTDTQKERKKESQEEKETDIKRKKQRKKKQKDRTEKEKRQKERKTDREKDRYADRKKEIMTREKETDRKTVSVSIGTSASGGAEVNEKQSGQGQKGRAGSRGRGWRQSTGRPDRQTGRDLPAVFYLDVCHEQTERRRQ